MSAADGGTGATTWPRKREGRRGRRGTATLVCVLLVGGLGLAVIRAPGVPAAGGVRAADAPWPAFAQTASDAGTWIVALRAFAGAETGMAAATEPAWPAFAQTASDAGTWLAALRDYAATEVQVEQAALAARAAAEAAAAAAASRPLAHTVTAQRAPAPPPAPWDGVVPPAGRATAWGCDAALAYLQAYAAPGFTLECPGDAEGHQGMTCDDEPGSCPGVAVIAIAVPCPQSYMNEASNSWVLIGRSNAPIDPYGGCR